MPKGLTAVGLHLTAERAVIECRMPIGFEDLFCKACGARRLVGRRLAHVLVGWRPTQLVVCLRRCACTLPPGVGQGHLGAGSATGAADPRGGGVGAAGPLPGCMSVSRLAAAWGSPGTANNAIREQTIVGNADRFDGVGHSASTIPPRFALVREGTPLRGATPGRPRARHRRPDPVRHRSDPGPGFLDVVPGRFRRFSRPGSPSATRTGVGGWC